MAEFARGAEKRILHGFLGGAEGVPDRPELQPLIVLHLKNNPFARREPLHRRGDPCFDLLADKCTFGIQRRAVLTLALEEISDAFFVNSRRSEEHTSELQSPYDLVCRLLL